MLSGCQHQEWRRQREARAGAVGTRAGAIDEARGALETLGTAGVDRSDGEEKRAKADAASTAAATPHHRAGNRSLAGDEQENLDPAAPIRDGSERIGDGGDAIAPRIDGESVEADDDAVPDSQATLGASSEDHRLGAMATRPAPSPDKVGDPDDVFAGIPPTRAAAPEPEDKVTAKLRERVFSETGRRLSAGWRASVETSTKKKRVRFFSPRTARGSGAPRTW